MRIMECTGKILCDGPFMFAIAVSYTHLSPCCKETNMGYTTVITRTCTKCRPSPLGLHLKTRRWAAAWGGGPRATFYEGAGFGPLIHRLTSRRCV